MPKNATFIPPTKATSHDFVPLNEIPQPIKDLAEKIYEHVRKTGSRVRLEWDSTQQRDTELHQFASYAAQRKAGKLVFRVSPTRNLPDTIKDVRLTADVVQNGKDAGNGKSTTHA